MSEIPNQPFNPNQPNYNQQVPPGGYQQYPPQGGYQNFGAPGAQIDLPGAGASQTCGIIGLILFVGLIGLILNIIAIVKGNNAMQLYTAAPGQYTERSFRKAKTGKTLGIIGLSLFAFAILIIILVAAAN